MFSHKFNNKNYHINKLYYNWKTVMLLNLCTQIRLSSLFIMWFEMKCIPHRMSVEFVFTRKKKIATKTANGFYALFIQHKWYIVPDNDAATEAIPHTMCTLFFGSWRSLECTQSERIVRQRTCLVDKSKILNVRRGNCRKYFPVHLRSNRSQCNWTCSVQRSYRSHN